MMPTLVPPKGVACFLSCPHNCVVVFRPGDDPRDYELTTGRMMTKRYGPVATKCPVNNDFYFAHTAWSIL